MTYQFRNADGTPVDPVPFFVTVLTAFLVTHAWGPVYLISLGVALRPAVAILTAVWLGIVVLAFRQLIWRNRPERREIIPTEDRAQKIGYAIIIGVLLLFVLSVPFLTLPS